MARAVEIKNFSYHYHDGTCALKDVNLKVDADEKLVLIGPNGAGKSTLLLAMSGFALGNGKVVVDGIEVKKKNFKKLRAIIGSCLENPDDQLFMPTLFEDVAFGPLNMGLDSENVKESVAKALDTVGLLEMAQKAPHHLSAGQKRAAAIATILSIQPKIITFDEPDGSLDPAHRKNLEKLLISLPQTLIIATCNMNFAYKIATKVALVNNGQVIAYGNSDEIMFDAELMESNGLETPNIY